MMTNLKLYVDDLRKCPEGWYLARTNTEAIRLLSMGIVEEISLDHDIMFACQHPEIALGHMLEETFMPVAYYIAIMEFKPKVRFHTGNIEAGMLMAAIMKVPFDHEMHHSEEEI